MKRCHLVNNFNLSIYIYILRLKLYIYIYIYEKMAMNRTTCRYKKHFYNLPPDIGMMVRVFANGPGSIPGRVVPKTKKWYLMLSCLTLSIIRYVWTVKWSNLGKGVAPLPTPRCSSYRKGSLRVTLDYGRLLYFTYFYIKHSSRQCWYGVLILSFHF